jgi:Domain of unknown function (DUF4388)
VTTLATVDRSFQYRGDLAETTLPEILNTIDRFQVPGVIEAARNAVVKHVYIREGSVVHATSSDRNDSLGSFLLRSGKLTREQYATIMSVRERGGKRVGVLVVEDGLLSPAEIYEAIRQHVEAIVWSLFYWQDGRLSFSIGVPPEDEQVRVQLPMRQVVLQGIKQAPSARALVARLGRRETVFAPAFQTEGLIELALDADDYRLLGLVDGRRTLYEICTEGPRSAADNAKLMYAFHVLQLIRKVQVKENGPEDRRAGERSGAIKIRFKAPGDRFPG